MLIREATDADLEDVLRVEREAFGRGDEAALVEALLGDDTARPLLSLVAEREGQNQREGRCVGHVLFTAVSIEGAGARGGAGAAGVADSAVRCAILAPLAVLPEVQGTGVGQALIEAGCRMLEERGVSLVFVLGDPGYYGRFGFEAAGAMGLGAPFPIEPEAAWRVRALAAGVVGSVRGKVRPADALAEEGLWRE